VLSRLRACAYIKQLLRQSFTLHAKGQRPFECSGLRQIARATGVPTQSATGKPFPKRGTPCSRPVPEKSVQNVAAHLECGLELRWEKPARAVCDHPPRSTRRSEYAPGRQSFDPFGRVLAVRCMKATGINSVWAFWWLVGRQIALQYAHQLRPPTPSAFL